MKRLVSYVGTSRFDGSLPLVAVGRSCCRTLNLPLLAYNAFSSEDLDPRRDALHREVSRAADDST